MLMRSPSAGPSGLPGRGEVPDEGGSLQGSAWVGEEAPPGMCYEVWLWLDDAVDAEVLEDWKARKAALSTEMRDAGIRGSRKKLGDLENELAQCFESCVAGVLRRSVGCCALRTRAGDMARGFEAVPGAVVYGWDVEPNFVRIWLELSGECGVDSLIDGWKEALPDVAWSPVCHVRGLSGRDCAAALRRLSAAMMESGVANGSGTVSAAEAGPEFRHVTVLLEESVDALLPAEGKVIVDATLGGGGHSELLLERGATVWGIDQDPSARRAACERLARFGSRFRVLAGNFRNAGAMLREQGVEAVDGVLADIGISSHQVDTPERGFSFREDGPLDMRMNPESARSAAVLVNEASDDQIADWLWKYGEERASRSIARAIVKARESAPIETTRQLASIIEGVLPRHGKQHPATRSFQALRIAVNDELGALECLLESGVSLLKAGGRMAVISFHSLEDRAIKQFFDKVSRPEVDRPEWPEPRPNPEYCARLVNRKPILPSEAELARNPRARSAKLRVIEKVSPR